MKIKILATVLILSFSFNTVAFADELAELKSGKNIIREFNESGSKVSETQLIFFIKAPPEKIWNILMDIEKYPEFMPVKKYYYKVKTNDYDVVHVEPEAPSMFNVSYDLKRTFDKKNWKMYFEKVAGKIKSINGYWKFEPVDSRYTKVIYVNNVEIGIPIPNFVKDYFIKGSLNKVADNVRKRVESNGTWKRN